jgi:uncharacterized protein YcbK (DUF882 family)
MGDLSPNFSAAEFACACGCRYGTRPGDVTPELLAMLEAVRKARGKALRLTSGNRCDIHNQRVGGVPDGEHTTGEAADVWAPSSAARLELVRCAVASGCQRIGVGQTFVHIGVSTALPPGLWGYGTRE